MTTVEDAGYTPVKVGDIVTTNEQIAGEVTRPSFNWGSVMPLIVCFLITMIVVTVALFLGQDQSLRDAQAEAMHDDATLGVSKAWHKMLSVPTPKPQVVAHIREYTYNEEAPPGDAHFEIPHAHHIVHHYDHSYDGIHLGGPRFDCMAGLASWQTTWHLQKKQWCCTHDDPKFCADKVLDCSSKPETWTETQKKWCHWKAGAAHVKSQYYEGIHHFYHWPSDAHHVTLHHGDHWYYGLSHNHPVGSATKPLLSDHVASEPEVHYVASEATKPLLSDHVASEPEVHYVASEVPYAK